MVEARPAFRGGRVPTSRSWARRLEGKGIVASGRLAVGLQSGAGWEGRLPTEMGEKEGSGSL